jgi:hypothetical protein
MAYTDFYTMTPGSAVADALQEILTRRKAEARQSMLDQLNQQNIESEISARNKQVASQDEARQDQIWQRRASLHGGDSVTGLSPEDVQTGMSGGWISQEKPQQGQSAYSYHWADTPESRKRKEDADEETKEQTAIDKMLMDPSLTPQDHKALSMVRGIPEARRNLLSTLLNREMNPPKPDKPYATLLPNNTYRYSDPSGKVINSSTLPAGYQVERGFEPQQPNAANEPQLFQIPDPSDPTGQKTLSVMARPSDLQHTKPGHIMDDPNVRVFGGTVRKGNEPPPQRPTTIPAATIANLRTAINAIATANQGFHIMGNPKLDAARQTLTNARTPFVNMLPTPTLQEDARNLITALDDPQTAAVTTNATTDEIINSLKQHRMANGRPPLTPEEEQAAHQIFPFLLGKF